VLRSFLPSPVTQDGAGFCPTCDNCVVDLTLKLVLAVLAIAVVSFALTRLLRHAGRRGWVFNKYNSKLSHPRSLGLLEQIYQPSIQHVIEFEITDRTDAEQDEAGEPPDPEE
jgi:hypothetical protein